MAYASSQNTAKVLTIEGCEVPAYKVPVNNFVVEHPLTNDNLASEQRIHSGEFTSADLSDVEVAKQFAMLAGNFNDILLHAADEELKSQACEAVLETVVRLQNPEYATDQVEVRNEATRLHDGFVKAKANALYGSYEPDYAAVATLVDPSEVLLDDFEEYITDRYNLSEMREQAAKALAPMIKPAVSEDFSELTGVDPEAVRAPRPRQSLLGAFVSRMSVTLRVA